MSRRFQFVTVGLFLLCACAIIQTYNHTMAGFSMGQLRFQTTHLALPTNSPEEGIWTTALSQPYHYIGKGCQFYVFESEDRQYVIKLLKSKHLRVNHHLEMLPLPLLWKKKIIDKNIQRTQRAARLMHSSELAFQRAANETGLLYLHWQTQAAHHPRLRLYDAIGLPHRISLDQHMFIVQRKAQPCTERLKELALLDERPFIEQMEADVKGFISLIEHRGQLGIRDLDRSFIKNIGYTTSGPVWMDIGQWVEDPSTREEENQEAEVRRRLGDMVQWAAVHIPDKQTALQNVVDHVLNHAQEL